MGGINRKAVDKIRKISVNKAVTQSKVYKDTETNE